MRIMVVDDEHSTCHLVRTILKSMGHEVMLSYDGEDALKRLSGDGASLPDLIILDIMLPKLSGYEVAQKLKASARLQNIPIVFFSARDKRELDQKANEIGAVGVILKPFAIEDFQKIVVDALH
jgi:two-component system alkaline phosphatase synthesis response regulator PhoP